MREAAAVGMGVDRGFERGRATTAKKRQTPGRASGEIQLDCPWKPLLDHGPFLPAEPLSGA